MRRNLLRKHREGLAPLRDDRLVKWSSGIGVGTQQDNHRLHGSLAMQHGQRLGVVTLGGLEMRVGRRDGLAQ